MVAFFINSVQMGKLQDSLSWIPAVILFRANYNQGTMDKTHKTRN